MSRSLIAALRKLRQAPGGGLASSQLSEGQRRELSSFARATGSIQMRPEGRGVVFEIRLPAVVEHQWRQLVPIEQAELVDGLPRRARNIAATRRSKGADHGHEFSYLLLKAGPGQVAWRDDKDNRLDLRLSTDQLGVAALTVHADSTWYTEHPLWLVENQALFDRTDWLPVGTQATLLYYGGQLDGRLLAWLGQRPRASRVVLFPDYDGVGLANFARLFAQLGDTCECWLMPDWQSKLARYGSQRLWQDTLREFTSAVLQLPDYLGPLTEQMRQFGLALEQEAVWLSVR